jgi:lysophospholipase L1-like esterase
MVVALLTWTVLYAPTLKRAAEASPIGVRRSVSLAVLTPIAAVSEFLALDEVTDAVERAVGRDPEPAAGGFVPPPEDIPVAPDDPDDDVRGDGGGPTNGPTNGNGDGDSGTGNESPTGNQRIRKPTIARPLRVVVVGDSLAAGLGTFAERVFRPRLVDVSRQGRISTGLARPDYFNWPYAMRRIVEVFDPDLVMVMIGENDHQSLATVQGTRAVELGTPEWRPAYRQRVLEMMRIGTSRGAKVVWAGLPIGAASNWWEHTRIQNAVFEYAASVTPGAVYYDAWDRFLAPDGGYTAYLREAGRVTLIRASDGLHFTAAGYTLVAEDVANLAVEEFGLTRRAFEPEP